MTPKQRAIADILSEYDSGWVDRGQAAEALGALGLWHDEIESYLDEGGYDSGESPSD